MKRILALGALLCAMMMAVGAFGAAPTNFAGTWVLDKDKSEGLRGPMAQADNITWTVTQDDKQLTVETPGFQGGATQKNVYKLDGSETTAEMGGRMPGKATMKAKWADGGKTLELNTVRTGEFQGNAFTATTAEHWELADGGKVLKIHRVSESPRGTQESKLTFNKK